MEEQSRLARNCLWIAALIMLLTIAAHSFGWSQMALRTSDEFRPVARLLWFCIAFDWAVVAVTYMFAANLGKSARPFVILASLIAVAAAVGMALTIGLGFPSLWALLLASIVAWVGAAGLK